MTTSEIIHDLKVLKDSFEEHTNGCSPICLEEAIKIVEERPQGKWVKSKDGYTRCDQCGSRGSAIKANFCHHCGADMREADYEE